MLVAQEEVPPLPESGVITGVSAAVIAIASALTVALGTLISRYFASRKELVEAETARLNSQHAQALALCEERLRLKDERIADLLQQIHAYQRGEVRGKNE